MKRLRNCLIVILLFVFSSCEGKVKMSHHAELAHEIMFQVANELHREDGLSMVGFGGAMNKDVELIRLGFVRYGKLSKDEARLLVMACATKLLDAVNSNEEIRPYLRNYPFTANNIDIAIYIHDEENRLLYHPDLGTVTVCRGRLTYATNSVEPGPYVTYETEPYEEALKIIQEQQSQ